MGILAVDFVQARVKLINEFILSVSPPDELLRILIPLTTY